MDRSDAASAFCCTRPWPLLFPLADGGVEIAPHAAVDLLEPEKAAASIARAAQAVEVALVAGADELERRRLALAAALGRAQPLDDLVGGVVVDGAPLVGDELGAADVDGRFGRFFARALVAA